MMAPDEEDALKASRADRAHALVKGVISSVPLVGGVGAEVFSMLLVAPLEKRRDRWVQNVANRLSALEAASATDLSRLATDDRFVSVLARSTQAALTTGNQEKLRLLAAAVENAALGHDVDADVQVLFVRYIDELTVGHFKLLASFRNAEASLSRVESFGELQSKTREISGFESGLEEFKLFCNDLSARVLIRINPGLADFPDVAEPTFLAAEGYADASAPNFRVTNLGQSLLRFVAERNMGVSSVSRLPT